MSKVAGCKRKLKTRTITEKYEILKEVEKGESSTSISKKHGVPKQTLSGWLKEKTKIYSEVEKNKTSAKRVRVISQSKLYGVFKRPIPKHSCVRNHFQG